MENPCGCRNLDGLGSVRDAGKRLLNNLQFLELSVDGRVCLENQAENDPL
jgi:hypothetical protein